MTAATATESKQPLGTVLDRSKREQQTCFATMMVHVDVEHDCEQRIQLALGLADRFQATLIGVAGLTPRPTFSAGAVIVYSEPTQDD
jgi:hypothetical protein